jgi:hypothetical protein
MKSWRHLTTNPEAIASAFGEIDPCLNQVEILNLEMPQPISYLNLTLSLNDYPVNPPIRWTSNNNNAVSLTLRCTDVSSFSLKRLAGATTASCEIREATNASSKYGFHLLGEGIEIAFQCDWISVLSITPYSKDRSKRA